VKFYFIFLSVRHEAQLFLMPQFDWKKATLCHSCKPAENAILEYSFFCDNLVTIEKIKTLADQKGESVGKLDRSV
jgi:hypothetical protein